MTKRKKKPVVGWTKGVWNELPQWRCNLCPWDTLEGEEVMLQHIRDVHTPKPLQKVVSRLPLVDRFGNPIEIVKEVRDG